MTSGDITREREIYYEELVHTIMGTEKSHDLLPVSWRPKKASGIIQSKSKGLRARVDDGVSPSLRAGEDEMRCPSRNSEAGKDGESFFFHPLFCQALNG